MPIVYLGAAVVSLLGIGTYIGTLKPAPVAATPTPVVSAASGGTHADATPHSPNVQSFGSYHVEAQVTKSGTVELFFYTGKAGQLMPIAKITGDVMEGKVIVPGEDSLPVSLSTKPYPSDGEGNASRFAGTFDALRLSPGQQIALSLSLPFDGQTYRIQWTPGRLMMIDSGAAHSTAPDAAMLAPVADAEGQKLFGTPGGLYTQADIIANSNTTTAAKFAGVMAKHNMKPGKGAKICPITNTAADARFVWIVGGKKYEFCCPPCVEEFMKQS